MEQKNEHQHTALLIMDLQASIVNGLGDKKIALMQSIAETIAFARKQEITVIYVVVGFRPGYPEVSASNKTFFMIKRSERNLDSEEAIQIDEPLKPQPGDIIVRKRRISAFTGSDLEVILRANNLKHLILTGVSTSGVVLSTIREAADKDYQLTVISDCCGDIDEEVHRMLTTKIFPRQAEVLTQRQWMESF